jgi:pimeloyl-ACP methyl ester carboxylesterase
MVPRLGESNRLPDFPTIGDRPRLLQQAEGTQAMGNITLANVSVDVWEDGDGPPLLFLHGAGGFRGDHPFLPLLGRHRHIIAPSHPGFGTSELPAWMDRPDDIAHAYLDLIDHFGLTKFDLIGCSLGGWIAAELASMIPDRIRRLVMVGAVGVKLGSRDQLDIPDIFALPDAVVEKLLFHEPERFRPDPAKLSDAELSVMLRNRESTALLVWEPYMHNPKLLHRLHRVTCPTLFLRGEHDGLVSAAYTEGYARLLPDARTTTIAAAGHVPQIEQPDAFVETALAFLNG